MSNSAWDFWREARKELGDLGIRDFFVRGIFARGLFGFFWVIKGFSVSREFLWGVLVLREFLNFLLNRCWSRLRALDRTLANMPSSMCFILRLTSTVSFTNFNFSFKKVRSGLKFSTDSSYTLKTSIFPSEIFFPLQIEFFLFEFSRNL